MAGMVGLRMMLHFFRTGNFNVGIRRPENLVIVGSEKEGQRVQQLLAQSQVQKNLIGLVSPQSTSDTATFLSDISRLDEVAQIYKVDEVIFCSSDVPADQIMHWMTRLGSAMDFKIVPKESISIIGSSSKNTSGELYTIDIEYKIAKPMARRNKRVFDFGTALCFLILFPLLLFLVKQPLGFLKNIVRVLLGGKSWVGYVDGSTGRSPARAERAETAQDTVLRERSKRGLFQKKQLLPAIKSAVLSPLSALGNRELDTATVQRLNYLYAKDYEVWRDWEVVWKGMKMLGATKGR